MDEWIYTEDMSPSESHLRIYCLSCSVDLFKRRYFCNILQTIGVDSRVDD